MNQQAADRVQHRRRRFGRSFGHVFKERGGVFGPFPDFFLRFLAKLEGGPFLAQVLVKTVWFWVDLRSVATAQTVVSFDHKSRVTARTIVSIGHRSIDHRYFVMAQVERGLHASKRLVPQVTALLHHRRKLSCRSASQGHGTGAVSPAEQGKDAYLVIVVQVVNLTAWLILYHGCQATQAFRKVNFDFSHAVVGQERGDEANERSAERGAERGYNLYHGRRGGRVDGCSRDTSR
ncbi:hypothetical protein N7522_006374 [Penicillium canescens]|nr:hypothetical protein N7522_006374 [Penicillium canescens]